MTRAELKSEVYRIVIEHLDIDGKVSAADNLSELGADTLSMIEIMLALEEELDVDIADEDLDALTTVGDLINYVAERKGVAA